MALLTSFRPDSSYMKQSPSESIQPSPIESNSQSTDVKTRRVVFVNGDPSRLLWIGYSEGRCISQWRRSEGTTLEPFSQTHRITLNSDPNEICFLSADKYFVSLNNGDVMLINTAGDAISEEKRFSSLHGSGDSRVIANIDNTLFSGSSSGSLLKVDIETGEKTNFKGDYSGVRSVCSLAGGSLLASGHSAGQLLLWDLRDWTARPVVTVPSKTPLVGVSALTAHPAQANLLSFGTDDGSLGFCDVRGTKNQLLPNVFDIASGSITQIRFHPECGEHMLCSSSDGMLVHWDASMVNQGKAAFGPASSRISAWFSDRLADVVQLNPLRKPSFSGINGFDISGHQVVAASDMRSIISFENVRFPIPSY